MTPKFKVDIWRIEGGYLVCDKDGRALVRLFPDDDGSGWWTCMFSNRLVRRPHHPYEQPDGADAVEKLAVRMLRGYVP